MGEVIPSLPMPRAKSPVLAPWVAPDRPVLVPRAPRHMVWLVTNECNARCVHCSSDARGALPAELDTREAMAMIGQLVALGVGDLTISGGEPLIRRDITQLIGYATERGLRVGLGSNGSTVKPRTAARLRRAHLDCLQISVDGLEWTHDEVRQWPGLFRRAERAVAVAQDAGLDVQVSFTAHRLNHRELLPVVEKSLAWGVRRFNFARFVPAGRGDWSLDLTPPQWRELTETFDRIQVMYADRLDFTTHLAQAVLGQPELACLPGFRGCQAGVGQGAVGPEGDVMPCVMLPVRVGNVRKESLAQIWRRSPVLTALRDRSRLGGACRDCVHVGTCGGCRAVAYFYTSDYLAADPRCWKSDLRPDQDLPR